MLKCSQFSRIPPIIWLLVGFVLFLSPHCWRYAVHHPDERHYTDAAMQMVETGDYLTPRTAAGDLRLKKPIVAYGMITASYQLLGVSTFASRFPFLLMGAGIVWLTYRLAWYLFDNRDTGLIAALVVSLQPALILSSMRSLPDIPLTFFLLVSAFGFVRLLREPIVSWSDLAMAFGGAGMAIASKGLPAVAFVGFATSLLVFVKIRALVGRPLEIDREVEAPAETSRHQSFRREPQPPLPLVARREWFRYACGILMTVLLGGSWFVAMGFLHGTELLTEFTNDQITHRVNRNILGILQDFMKVLLLLVVGLLPWWGWLREAIVVSWRQHGPLSFLRNPEWLLVTIWIAVYLGLAALVDRVNFRYLTPIIPLVALSAAGLMAELSADRRGVWCRRLGWSGVIVVALFTLLATGISLEFGKTVSLGIALAIAAGIWIVVCVVILVRPSAWQPVSVYSTLCILLLASVSYVTIYSVSRQTLGERLWEQLEKMEVGDRSIAFATKPCYPARLRVESGGQSQTHWLGFELPESMGKVERLKHDVLVLNTEDAVGIDRSQFEVISIADGFQRIDTGDLCRAALAGQLSEYVDAKRGEIWLAIKRQPELQPDQRSERIANNPVDAVNF